MTSEITTLRERIKQLEEDAETYAYKDQANFDLRSRIVTLESDNNRLTKERDTLKNKIKESGRYKLREQLAAAQATNERLREALQKGHRQLIYKLGGTYKDGYGGSDRDVEAAVLMYEALAIEPAQQEPLGVTEGTATPAGAAPLPDEVAQMVERLRIRTGSRMVAEQLCIEAAEMIERPARQVPEGCVVVQRKVTEEAKCVMATPGNYRTYQDQWAALIAAGEVK